MAAWAKFSVTVGNDGIGQYDMTLFTCFECVDDRSKACLPHNNNLVVCNLSRFLQGHDELTSAVDVSSATAEEAGHDPDYHFVFEWTL
jgi:hypothetical protein